MLCGSVHFIVGMGMLMVSFVDIDHRPSCMQHPCLVRLLGVCLEPSFGMVLEFLPNGDLFGYMHPTDETSIPRSRFPWNVRLKIVRRAPCSPLLQLWVCYGPAGGLRSHS